jgi:Mrp family chromosome partitioning ATPase
MSGTKTTALIKQDLFEPRVRFPGKERREGNGLLRTLRKYMNDREVAFTIQGIRDQIHFHDKEKGTGRTIGFAGPRGGEGTTSLSILLGLTLAELKRNRVVFLDGRMEPRSFSIYSAMFGLTKNALSYSNGCGLFECFNAKNRNLCFLAPCGAIESLEVFSSAEFAHLVADLREAFDFILFDLPPFLGSSEARLALSHLDLFFLVCAARKTTCADVEKCKKIAASAGCSVHGAVLNRQKVPFWTSLFGKNAFF